MIYTSARPERIGTGERYLQAEAPALVERRGGLLHKPLGLGGGEIHDAFRRDGLNVARGERAGVHHFH